MAMAMIMTLILVMDMTMTMIMIVTTYRCMYMCTASEFDQGSDCCDYYYGYPYDDHYHYGYNYYYSYGSLEIFNANGSRNPEEASSWKNKLRRTNEQAGLLLRSLR